MYSIFIGAPVKRLSDILKELKEHEADPFVYAAIEHALERVNSRRKGRVGLRYVKSQDLTQSLDTQLRKSLHLIAKPFTELLSKPDTAQNILEELEVLRTRFYNFYMSLNVDWSCPLDTKNDLLEQIRWVDIPTMARAISKKAKALFSEYLRSAFTREGDEARSILNKEWDLLSKGVKEIVAANIGLCSQVDTLANCLYRFRNYYSLTAVIQGIQASGYRTVALETFGYLLNPKDDYRHYLMEMNMEGALHFLFPVLLQYQRGEPMFTEMAIGAFKFYTLDAYQSTPGMQFSPLDIATAATKATCSTGYKKPSLDCPFVSCFFVGFGS
ncbi:hypothetical protein POX_f07396 [Penicillium oxalicum]|nr:hypothetical protein POX_f07396 [Penicillium oxalicum]KAI2787041.1 hypothetical protein POX_f07396 [Penicillium oxalicum]